MEGEARPALPDGATRTPGPRYLRRTVSHHVLPVSATLIGISATMVGLVKVVEGHAGPSHLDEISACAALFFLASVFASYIAIRRGDDARLSQRSELAADYCFLGGLSIIAWVALTFAYDVL